MHFLWPQLLWILPALAVLPLLYGWRLRQRNRLTARWRGLDPTRSSTPGTAADGARTASVTRWRPHVAPALLLAACALLALAAARPVAPLPLPWTTPTLLLTMDVSRSMRVTDVQPTRLAAAQEAARLFLRDLPRDIDVGLITFAGGAQVVQRATRDREALLTAIDGFQMQYGTAIGDAIALSLAELFPDHGIEVGEMSLGGRPRGRSLDDRVKPPPKQITPVAPGSYAGAAIILLTDGRRTNGIDTLEAARMAADRGVRVHVVGLGAPGGAAAAAQGMMPIWLQFDEPVLREVARMTGGEYHHASTADQLNKVYQGLGARLQVQIRETEVAGPLALLALLLALAGTGLSVAWFGRIA